ncbi:HAD hydrolase-like protein [Azospirillum sp. B2RO_4]|uniref:HAD family hydrolase n=1 Tax=Azospirillum sp. B2RO_4 TaxID=3027796 RepID=UPI003DA8DA00
MQLLVCDLDNTLYDWVSYFVPSLYAMIEEASKVSGIPENELVADMQKVHQKHKDVEHPFSLIETNVIKNRYAGLSDEAIALELNSAFYAFNRSRKKNLCLYEGVDRTLACIKEKGIKIAAHTESRFHSVIDRLTRLNIEKYFDNVYCLQRTEFSRPYKTPPNNRYYSVLNHRIKELLHRQRKPSPDVLIEICRSQGIEPSRAVYIGDSIIKDVAMANSAGVFSVWAKYGTSFDRGLYEKLVKVSHWSVEDIEREMKLKEDFCNEKPMAIADEFSDILSYIL